MDRLIKQNRMGYIEKGARLFGTGEREKGKKYIDWEKELDEYLKTEEHLFDCCGYSEGLECCLEKKWIRNFIRRLLKDAKS